MFRRVQGTVGFPFSAPVLDVESEDERIDWTPRRQEAELASERQRSRRERERLTEMAIQRELAISTDGSRYLGVPPQQPQRREPYIPDDTDGHCPVCRRDLRGGWGKSLRGLHLKMGRVLKEKSNDEMDEVAEEGGGRIGEKKRKWAGTEEGDGSNKKGRIDEKGKGRVRSPGKT